MDTDKATRIAADIMAAGRNVAATEFHREISKIMIEEKPDADTILKIMGEIVADRFQDQWTALKQASEILRPYLDVQLIKEQNETTIALTKSANWLWVATIIFAAVQTAAAVISLFKS